MDVLIRDRTSGAAEAVAAELEAHGHTVRTCATGAKRVPCAALGGEDCPLDLYPIDVAVRVGSAAADDHLGEGELCATRRRIPLVLVDDDGGPLQRWAAAAVPAAEVAKAVTVVRDQPLPGHSAEARRVARAHLRQQGRDASMVDVAVRRRNGGLLIDLVVDGSLPPHECERLAVHTAQAVRGADRWARGIDVSVRRAETTS
jgi:hypothetical protein